MRSARSIGRIIGSLLLVQLAGFIVPFALLLSITTDSFLIEAAGSSYQIKVAVFLLFANCVLTICISITAFSMFREYGPAAALLLVGLSFLMFALQAVDNAHLMSMLSLSERYVQSGGSNDLYQAVSATVRSTRKWLHYSELLTIDAWIFTLFGFLFRYALVPRGLAAFGFVTALIHFIVIPLPLILGYGSSSLGAAMALGLGSLAAWLIAKGFREPLPQLISEPTLQTDANLKYV
jgi:hypothetical protein